jgi:hypothetical protein
VETLMKNAFAKLEGDLAGEYYPLLGMAEDVRQKLVDDHFLFMSGDRNLQVRDFWILCKLAGENTTPCSAWLRMCARSWSTITSSSCLAIATYR